MFPLKASEDGINAYYSSKKACEEAGKKWEAGTLKELERENLQVVGKFREPDCWNERDFD
jgi:hypothetical protein